MRTAGQQSARVRRKASTRREPSAHPDRPRASRRLGRATLGNRIGIRERASRGRDNTHATNSRQDGVDGIVLRENQAWFWFEPPRHQEKSDRFTRDASFCRVHVSCTDQHQARRADPVRGRWNHAIRTSSGASTPTSTGQRMLPLHPQNSSPPWQNQLTHPSLRKIWLAILASPFLGAFVPWWSKKCYPRDLAPRHRMPRVAC